MKALEGHDTGYDTDKIGHPQKKCSSDEKQDVGKVNLCLSQCPLSFFTQILRIYCLLMDNTHILSIFHHVALSVRAGTLNVFRIHSAMSALRTGKDLCVL